MRWVTGYGIVFVVEGRGGRSIDQAKSAEFDFISMRKGHKRKQVTWRTYTLYIRQFLSLSLSLSLVISLVTHPHHHCFRPRFPHRHIHQDCYCCYSFQFYCFLDYYVSQQQLLLQIKLLQQSIRLLL
jgi:hypothetical protein